MKGADIFHPQERAILFDYFGRERPEALQRMEVFASVAGEDDPAQPLLIEPNSDGERSSYGIANAVARLLLMRIQSRLPQWVGRQDGEIVFGPANTGRPRHVRSSRSRNFSSRSIGRAAGPGSRGLRRTT